MRKFIMMTVVFIMGVNVINAQDLSIENVYKVTLRNSDAIKEGSEVKGYYFFYVNDKVDRKTNAYTLKITDANLKTLKDITFEDSKYVSVIESSFNGTDIIFLMYNSDARTFEYQTYGADGKRKFTYNRELSKKEIRLLKATYLTDDEDDNFKGLYPIEGKGFILNMPSREDKDYTFQLDFFSTQKRKQWTYIPTDGAKKFLGDYLGTNNGVVYMEVLKLTSNFDSKPDSYILGLDLETGKQLFEVSTDQQKYKFYPATMSVVNGGKAYIFGEYFDANGNIMKDKSLGFAFWGIDEKGKFTSEKYNSWGLELGKFLEVGKKGRIDDFGYMFLHNIVQAADGNIFAVGEGYFKNVSALGIMSQIASQGGGGLSVAKLKITDMVLIKFDKDFNVTGATIYDKNPNKVELPNGYGYVSTPMLGKIVKAWGRFDYSYTQVNKDKTAFTVCYSDYVRGKDYKGGTFNAINYADGKVTTDHINTKSEATRSAVMPGKQGQVLILDWYKKKKQLVAHFEKLN